jgi:hypothetical protein
MVVDQVNIMGVALFESKRDPPVSDIYEREHKTLPEGYIHALGPDCDWYFEPAEQEFAIHPE